MVSSVGGVLGGVLFGVRGDSRRAEKPLWLRFGVVDAELGERRKSGSRRLIDILAKQGGVDSVPMCMVDLWVLGTSECTESKMMCARG